MILQQLHTLFGDIHRDNFNPASFPEYPIGRILEYGDREAICWLKENFPEAQIQEVIRAERRLTRKSANFWAVVYGIPKDEVAALQPTQ